MFLCLNLCSSNSVTKVCVKSSSRIDSSLECGIGNCTGLEGRGLQYSSPTPSQGRPISQSPQAAQVEFPLLPWWDFGVGKRSIDVSIRIKWPGQHNASPCRRASECRSVTPDVPHVDPRSVTYLHVAPEKMLLGFYQYPLGWKGSQLCLCLSCLPTLNSTHSDSDAQERYDIELPSNSRAGWTFHFCIQPST